MSARSFDRSAPRPAPGSLVGVTAEGRPVRVALGAPTLVVAVKEACDGCRDVLERGVDVPGVEVVVVAASAAALADARGLAVVAPEAMEALGLRWPPAYALVAGDGPRVVAEGAVFSAEQVAAEVAAALA